MKINQLKVIIIGANSHIAKGLIYNFLKDKNINLYLCTTDKNKTKFFLDKLEEKNLKNLISINGYNKPFVKNADLIINCVGVGTPKQLNGKYNLWFEVLEKFDNLCLDYIKKK